MEKMVRDSDINISEEQCQNLLIEHICDMLLFDDKLLLLKYLYGNKEYNEDLLIKLKRYLDTKFIVTSNLKGMMLYSENTLKMMLLLTDGKWIPAEPEDERELLEQFARSYRENNYDKYNNLVGFIGYVNKNKYLAFKVKDTTAKRNTGARCDEAAKTKKIKVLNDIFSKEDKFTAENTKGMVQSELCSLQELVMRHFNNKRIDGKVWFLDFEMAMLLKF
jgi:hypothetical protein